MEIQLKNLSDSLIDKGILLSGLKVQNLNKKMEVRGFIPVAYDDNVLGISDISLDLCNFDVVADKVRIPNSLRKSYGTSYILYPIARKIEIPKNKDVISVTNNLRLPDYSKDNKLDRSKINTSSAFEIKDSEINYHLQQDDILFYRKSNDIQFPIAIAKSFYCLCIYENSVTGKLDYCIADPWDLVLIS